MGLKERTDRLFGKKNKEEGLLDSVVGLMEYFGWSLSDVKKLSIPSFFVLVKVVNRLEKKKEELSKKKKK